MTNFDLNTESRSALQDIVKSKLEDFYGNTKALNVSSNWNIDEVKAFARSLSFDEVSSPDVVLNNVIQGLTDYSVHTPHPNYYGLFNPRPNFTSILADTITATFNPQLAAWSHSPFANEIENYVIQEFAKKFGYTEKTSDGTFCTGGAESNMTAMVCALNHYFPQYSETGINGCEKQPIVYCSSQSHHSIVKAAKITGLGAKSVVSIPVNEKLQLDIEALKKQIRFDSENGRLPFMVVATAGTTGSGAIDDLNALHLIAREENLWLHVDAAYGGAAIISEKYNICLSGIELSDSITLDLHKWFSVPMGASLFLTSHKNILHRSFSVKTEYMPEDGDPNQIIDPYIHSAQWSRRFIGLKIYLPLAVYGWEGYQQIIEHQIEMANLFRNKLQDRGWEIANSTVLPIICFRRKDLSDNSLAFLVSNINNSGKAWLSVYPIRGQNTARICITNYSTSTKELEELLNLLEASKFSL